MAKSHISDYSFFLISFSIILLIGIYYLFLSGVENNDIVSNNNDNIIVDNSEKNVADVEYDIDCDNAEDLGEFTKCQIDARDCSKEGDECYYAKAQTYQDETMCFNIEDETRVAACTATIQRSQMLEDVVLSDDLTLCDKFEDQANIDFCEDNYYIAKRFNEDDLKYCDNIKNDLIKNECLRI